MKRLIRDVIQRLKNKNKLQYKEHLQGLEDKLLKTLQSKWNFHQKIQMIHLGL